MSSPDQVPPPLPASAPAAPARTKRRLKRIAPLSAGTMLALLHGVMGLIFLPFFALAILGASQAPDAQAIPFAAVGAALALFAPVAYAAMGFVTGALGAVLYNFFVRWTGGIEFQVE